MPQIADPKLIEQATLALKARIARVALLHIDKVDVRTGTVLEIGGLFRRTGDRHHDAQVEEIVLNKRHSARLQTAGGPTLFYRDPENANRRFALDMANIFLNTDNRLRLAALEHFAALAANDPPDLSVRTRRLLEEHWAMLLHGDPDRWQPVAVALYDAVSGDLRCQIAGTRQSLTERYEEGLQRFIPRLLRPSLSAFESLELSFVRPSDQLEQIRSHIEAIVRDSASIRAACDAYVSALGTLPLAGSVSFAEMVRAWTRYHGTSVELRHELWEWATASGPVARFYAATWFLVDDDQQMASAHGAAPIDAIVEQLQLEADDKELSNNQWFWKIAQELAQHYLRHLEMSAPGAFGEPLAIWSWWLAEQISTMLCADIRVARHLRDIAVLPEAHASELSSRLANARITASPASIATYWASSPWQLSILGALQQATATALSGVLTDLQRERIETSIMKHALFWNPTAAARASKRTYLFEAELQDSIRTWTTIFNVPERKDFLIALGQLYAELIEPECFCQRFKDIGVADEANQIIIANAARLLSLRDALPVDRIWDQLMTLSWRNETFRALKAPALEILFMAFASSLHRAGEKWPAGLPHLYADACEHSADDAQRRELLFVLTLLSCVHCYSVSALERLLSGSCKEELAELARGWRGRLLDLTRTAPPWVVARIRCINAAISAAQ